MDCGEIINRLSDLQDGALSETSENEIRRHLSVCAGCQAVARSLETVREGLRNLPPEPAPPELLERIREAVAREAALSVSGSTAAEGEGAKIRPAWGFAYKAAAMLLFASLCWYAAGFIPGKEPQKQAPQGNAEMTASPKKIEANAQDAAPHGVFARDMRRQSAPAETTASLQNFRQSAQDAAPRRDLFAAAEPRRAPPPPRAAQPPSRATVGSPTPAFAFQDARAPSRAANDEFSGSAQSAPARPAPVQTAARAIQSEQGERSFASLPEDISEPKIRVYSLADLPAAPVLRAGTRFARVQPYAPASSADAEAASRDEAKLKPESEKHDIESRTARLRPPAPYGRELSVDVDPEERDETADRIAQAAKRLGGAVEGIEVDHAAIEGTVVVRVLLPERTAPAFIDELRRNGKLPPEAAPQRSIIPAGPTPGTVAYAVRLHPNY